jgi:hypothetical protein
MTLPYASQVARSVTWKRVKDLRGKMSERRISVSKPLRSDCFSYERGAEASIWIYGRLADRIT